MIDGPTPKVIDDVPKHVQSQGLEPLLGSRLFELKFFRFFDDVIDEFRSQADQVAFLLRTSTMIEGLTPKGNVDVLKKPIKKQFAESSASQRLKTL